MKTIFALLQQHLKTAFAFLKQHLKTFLIACGVFFCIMIIVIVANSEDDSYTPDSANNLTSSNFSSWSIKDYTDEFGITTGKQYLKTTVSGTFSNTIGKEQNLKVEVQASSESVSIILWEYGTSQLESLFDSTQYIITVLDQSGEKHRFHSYLQDGKPYLAVANYSISGVSESSSDLINIFKSSGTVKLHIVNSDDKDNTYSFSIKTDGFADLYEKISSPSQVTE